MAGFFSMATAMAIPLAYKKMRAAAIRTGINQAVAGVLPESKNAGRLEKVMDRAHDDVREQAAIEAKEAGNSTEAIGHTFRKYVGSGFMIYAPYLEALNIDALSIQNNPFNPFEIKNFYDEVKTAAEAQEKLPQQQDGAVSDYTQDMKVYLKYYNHLAEQHDIETRKAIVDGEPKDVSIEEYNHLRNEGHVQQIKIGSLYGAQTTETAEFVEISLDGPKDPLVEGGEDTPTQAAN